MVQMLQCYPNLTWDQVIVKINDPEDDSFKKDWSEYTVAGQMQKFRLSGAPQKQDGWYVVPGRVDVACWVLLGFFVLTLVLMAWFAQLGHGAG